MAKFKVTIPVTFTVRADDATEAEHAAMDAVDGIELVDCVESAEYTMGPKEGLWAEEVVDA